MKALQPEEKRIDSFEDILDVNIIKSCQIIVTPVKSNQTIGEDLAKLAWKKVVEISVENEIKIEKESKKYIVSVEGILLEVFLIKKNPSSAIYLSKDSVLENIIISKTPEEYSFFEDIIIYPNRYWEEVYEELIGLEFAKKEIDGILSFIFDFDRVKEWSKKHYNGLVLKTINTLQEVKPFFIFEGDVGCGKTVLAKSFGSVLAKKFKKIAYLFQLSKRVRGSGIVGEMSKNINMAIRFVSKFAEESGDVAILLIDEADTLLEKRVEEGMHHEDRAGVNTFIEVIDSMKNFNSKVIIVATTNLGQMIDPAVKRRTYQIINFKKPGIKEIKELLKKYLENTDLKEDDFEEIAKKIEGVSYSDITRKILPRAILESVKRDTKLTKELILEACNVEVSG